jgi:hypothetical protein
MSIRPVVEDPWRLLFDAMSKVRASWPSRGWSWDARWSCVTSSFSLEFEERARTAAGLALPSQWTSRTLPQAPPSLRDLAARTGGLREGQMIFASDATAAAYGLWWPWGDDVTTSFRIGLGEPAAKQDAVQRLRDVFGVEL